MVVGAGQMGAGIAQVALQSDLSVTLVDLSRELLDKAVQRIGAGLLKLQEKGKLDEAKRKGAVERLKVSASIAAVKEVDFAIEAVTENESLKKQIFKELDLAVRQGGVLATNTSSIPVTGIGAATRRPDAVIGMHFMNPVPLMSLVEIIRGAATSDASYSATRALAERMGKTTVLSRDFPGFIVNRILIPMLNEACFAVMEGLGSIQDIDTAMKLGTNQPMGPLQLADFIGLDTVLYIAEVLHQGLGDDKYRPCPLLKQYVDAGWLGKKTGINILLQQRTGAVFVISQSLVKDLGDVENGIQADEVCQLERAHRLVGPQLHRSIDVLNATQTFHHRKARLVEHRDQNAVDDEARKVPRKYRRLPHPFGERARRRVAGVGSCGSPNDLHQAHQWNWVHEVHSDHRVRSASGCSDPGDRN